MYIDICNYDVLSCAASYVRLHCKNLVVNCSATILTTFCSEERHYFLQWTSLLGGQCSDVHYKISIERHYTKIVSIVADISSDVH